MQKIIKRMVQAMALVAVILAVSVPASAAQIKVDGDPSDWSGVDMQSSDNGKIAKWAVLRDDKNVYFYVQQNGGNEYGLPITDTHFSIAYGSGVGGSNTQIRFTYMMTQLKNAYYGDINGTKQAYQPSKEAGKYEIEFSVPQSYFTEDDHVITYCGSSVKSKDIKKIQAAATPTPTTAAYHGITIDGSVGDWDAVSRTSVDDKWLKEIACVWDGDYFYIYLKEKETGSATTAGEKSNGKFTIYTDLGRHTVFKLYKDKIDGIDGAKVSYSNKQYEIAIPSSAIRQYKETVSFGYYMSEDRLVKDIANLKDEKEEKKFQGIEYDGNYTDWDYYPHQLVQYSTSGGVGNDAEAALYLDNTTLHGHVLSTLHMNEREFQPFTIRINEKDKTSISFRLVKVDAKGNIEKDCQVENLDAGEYEYYLWDLSSGSSAKNIHDKDVPIYGRMYLTVRQDAEGKSISDEMEYEIDMKKLAKHFQMDTKDMKVVQAQYINIGTEWVTTAGTSTGAAMGISLCAMTVLAVLFYRKRKTRVKNA